MGKKKIKRQHLKKARIDNYKGLKHVEFDVTEKHLILLGGANGAGKTSVLDAMKTLLYGKKYAIKPVRDGEEEAVIEAELTDLLVKLVIKPNGNIEPQWLDLESGRKVTGGKKEMRALFGSQAIDPFRFRNLKPAEQREQLRSMVLDKEGNRLDTSVIEAEYEKLYEIRKEKKAAAKRAQANLEKHPAVEDAPESMPSTSETLAELKKLQEHNQAVRDANSAHDTATREETAAEREVDRIKKMLADAEKALKAAAKRTKAAAKQVESVGEEKSTGDLEEQLQNAEILGDKFRDQEEHLEAREEFRKAEEEADKASKDVDECQARIREVLESGIYPASGMTVTDEGVLIDGVPFDDVNRARQDRALIEAALFDKPDAPIMLIDNGEGFDDESLKLLDDILTEKDAQAIVAAGSRLQSYDIFVEDGTSK